MKYSLRKLALLFILPLGFSANAQVKNWTLEECVEYALKNNISIKQSELDLKISDIEKLEALGNFIPNVSGSANYGINTGTNINPTTNQFENQSFRSASANINTSINLFNGLLNWKNVQRVKLNKMANTYRLDKMKDDIALSVANSYLQILFNKEQLKVLVNQNKITKENLIRTNELIKAGTLPAGDIYDLNATDASQEQQIIVAQNTLIISKLALAQTLLLEDYANFDVGVEEMAIPKTEILLQTPQAIIQKAKEVVNDIKIAQANVDVSTKDIEITRAGYLPTLAGFASYNTRWSQTIPIGFVDQLSLFDGTNIGLQLNVPVLNGFATRGRVQRSKISQEKSKLVLNQADLDLERTVFQAYNDLKTAKAAYEAALKTSEARKFAQGFSKERYDVGLLNSFDYSQALLAYENAQSEVLRAKYDYIFKIKLLEFYFGIPIIQKQ
ncbi:TolC family protein [Flavobacterium sp.]|uniref:TolC family protein n=1 Tax=Flavobacterium sp. TaxID=239 RepID=UPI002489C14D|nr:TolC family protein [Flavobacterium sp.]MDI1318213.1 TolC family protein [Flavobacterium sp.]